MEGVEKRSANTFCAIYFPFFVPNKTATKMIFPGENSYINLNV